MNNLYGRPVQAAVTPETRKELEELAEAAGLTLAAFIRQILEEYTGTDKMTEWIREEIIAHCEEQRRKQNG